MRISRRIIPTAAAVALVLSSVGQALAQTATVSLSSEKQFIRGFGGMNHPVWIADLTDTQRTTAFGNEDGQLGMTILRMWVSDRQNDWTRDVATAKRAQELGAIVFATPWNPPSSMTRTVNGAKSIDPAQFSAYASHLNGFVTYMKDNGVDLYAIAVQNEPDYAQEWTKWTQNDVYDFVLNYGAQIQTRLITAESFNYNKSYYDKILNDPNALANVDIVGAHLYGTQLSAFPYPLYDQKAAGKERWMTEHYTDSKSDADSWPLALDVAFEMHNSMVEAQFNAYVWWYIRRSYGPMKEDGTISKRGYCFAHFSKFVRPGYHRVDATKNPTTDVYVSAYKGEANVVVVIVNRGTASKSLTLEITGTEISAYDRFTTSSSKSLKNEGKVNGSNGSISVTLDAQSVTTLHGADNSSGLGGSPGTGGSTSTGGATAGGSKPTGGSTSTGATAGGSKPIGGSLGTGGSTNSGGSTNTTGGVASAGASSIVLGGTDSGGMRSTGGITAGGDTSSSGGLASTTSASSTAQAGSSVMNVAEVSSDDGGCGCRMAGARSKSKPFLSAIVLGALALGALRRRVKITLSLEGKGWSRESSRLKPAAHASGPMFTG